MHEGQCLIENPIVLALAFFQESEQFSKALVLSALCQPCVYLYSFFFESERPQIGSKRVFMGDTRFLVG